MDRAFQRIRVPEVLYLSRWIHSHPNIDPDIGLEFLHSGRLPWPSFQFCTQGGQQGGFGIRVHVIDKNSEYIIGKEEIEDLVGRIDRYVGG